MNLQLSTPLHGRNDLDACWMPFTANRAFKPAPRMIASAKDRHDVTPDGRRVLSDAPAPSSRSSPRR